MSASSRGTITSSVENRALATETFHPSSQYPLRAYRPWSPRSSWKRLRNPDALVEEQMMLCAKTASRSLGSGGLYAATQDWICTTGAGAKWISVHCHAGGRSFRSSM